MRFCLIRNFACQGVNCFPTSKVGETVLQAVDQRMVMMIIVTNIWLNWKSVLSKALLMKLCD